MEECLWRLSGSGIDEKIILSMRLGLIDDYIRIILSVPFCPYHFVHIPFCPLPFCPRTVAFFAHWTYCLITMQWCCYMDGNVGECCSLISLCERMCSLYFLMLPFSFSTNYTGIIGNFRIFLKILPGLGRYGGS